MVSTSAYARTNILRTSPSPIVDMAGLQKYSKREIVFVMYRMINKVKNEDIVKQFHAEFGRLEFDETQVRYMGNKYGDDVKYGCVPLTIQANPCADVFQDPSRRTSVARLLGSAL